MKIDKLIEITQEEKGFETTGETLSYLLNCFDELNYRDWRIEDLNLSINQYLKIKKTLEKD